MRSLAGFAMRGRSQAALVAAGVAVLSLVLPPVAVISSAAVALVTLRQGPREGLLVVGIAALGSGVLAWLALGAPRLALGFLVVLWVPLWVLALVLRATRNLALTVQGAALIGLLILLGLHLLADDPAAYWVQVMEPLRLGLVEGGVLADVASRTLVEGLAEWMTGAFAASLYVQFLLALFLARWWQASLYNPGGFGAEFRDLRLSPVLGYVALAMIGVRLWQPEAVWGYELLVSLSRCCCSRGWRWRMGSGTPWVPGPAGWLASMCCCSSPCPTRRSLYRALGFWICGWMSARGWRGARPVGNERIIPIVFSVSGGNPMRSHPVEEGHEPWRPGRKVSVRPGYGRNYLIPGGYAASATEANLKAFEERRAELEREAEQSCFAPRNTRRVWRGCPSASRARAATRGGCLVRWGPATLPSLPARLGSRSTRARCASPRAPCAPWVSTTWRSICTPTCRAPSRWRSSPSPEIGAGHRPAWTVPGSPGVGRDGGTCRFHRCSPTGYRHTPVTDPGRRGDMNEPPHPGSEPGFEPGLDAGYSSGFPSGFDPSRATYDAEALRIPPHSIQAEQSLLGALMQGGNTWERVADQVGEGDFYRREHRSIFGAIKSLAEGDEPCDLVTVTESLERRGELEDAGGLPYVGRLVQGTSSIANIEAYARIVRYHSVLRQLIAAGTDIADLAYNPKDRKPPELLDEAERKVFAIAEQLTRGGGFPHIKPLLVKAIERIDQLHNSNEAITGLPTGFTDFDEKTSGLQNSDLIIVAGRPSMGKCCAADTRVLGAMGASRPSRRSVGPSGRTSSPWGRTGGFSGRSRPTSWTTA